MTDSFSMPDIPADSLADEVSRQVPIGHGTLDRVGMRGIEMPVRVVLGDESFLLPAKVSAAVDLCDPTARGIHMSRLYRLCNAQLTSDPLEPVGLKRLLDAMLESHTDLSQHAYLDIEFTVPVLRPALLSGLSGWRQYPIRLQCERDAARWRCVLAVDVLYSSTCPGSAAMARQVVAQRFTETFGTGSTDAATVAQWLESAAGGAATPHAQRSLARVAVNLGEASLPAAMPMLALIDAVEAALQTAVQGAVKRVDEQEFARLNGENPLYCEDAVRRIRTALELLPWVTDYRIEAAHLESLHPHDAVASAVKGVAGGFQP